MNLTEPMSLSLAATPCAAPNVAPVVVSFESVYRQHFASVWRVLRRLGVPEAQLDDAAQDAFVVVHRRLPESDCGSAPRSWLYAIAVRVASEYRRRNRRRPTEALPDVLLDPGPSPAQQSELNEAVQLLHALLNELDEAKRTVFVLAELEQLTVPEIAEVLGVNHNTVYSRLRAARKRFEAALTRHRAAQGSAR